MKNSIFLSGYVYFSFFHFIYHFICFLGSCLIFRTFPNSIFSYILILFCVAFLYFFPSTIIWLESNYPLKIAKSYYWSQIISGILISATSFFESFIISIIVSLFISLCLFIAYCFNIVFLGRIFWSCAGLLYVIISIFPNAGHKFKNDSSFSSIASSSGSTSRFSDSWGENDTTYKITGSLSQATYWTPNGKSYHFSKNCPSLSRSKTINSGTLSDALDEGKTDPCNNCADG